MIRSVLWATLLVTTPAFGGPATATTMDRVVSEQLYEGVLASELLSANVVSKSGILLGKVRNIEIADDGQVRALIAEQPGTGLMPEFVFRLPWKHVVQPLGGPVITADLLNTRSREFSLFGLAQGDDDKPSNFLVTQVLGDYARLQTGMGYGYVNDIVFSKDGRMVDVLVAKEGSGGTYAFSYPGRTGRWSASMSYYGLPFVTTEQADAAGRKVKLTEFETGK